MIVLWQLLAPTSTHATLVAEPSVTPRGRLSVSDTGLPPTADMYENFTNIASGCQHPCVQLHASRALVDGRLVEDCTVTVTDGFITDVGTGQPSPNGADVVVDGGVLAPGFIDLHVHALDGAGVLAPDVADAAGLGRALARRGVTAFAPTTVTSPVPALIQILAGLPAADTVIGARFLGAHLEGPWLSPARPGAQPREHLAAPDVESLARLLDAGAVAMVTIAGELPGALPVITAASDAGVVVGLGHTDATYDEVRAAVDAGARHVTHCFNAMSPLHHREPGMAGAALELPGLTVEAIADGAHLHPAVVRLLWRARGAREICLVSDAVDLGDGEGLQRGPDGALRRPDGVLAGSGIGLDSAVRNAVAWGIPLADALTMASTTPADALGRRDIGRLAVGTAADLVLLDRDLAVHTVVVAGQVVHQASDLPVRA